MEPSSHSDMSIDKEEALKRKRAERFGIALVETPQNGGIRHGTTHPPPPPEEELGSSR